MKLQDKYMKVLFLLLISLIVNLPVLSQSIEIIYPESAVFTNDDTLTTADFNVYDSLHVQLLHTDSVNCHVYFESSIFGSVWGSDSVGAISDTSTVETGISITPGTGISKGRIKIFYQSSGNDSDTSGLAYIKIKEWGR